MRITADAKLATRERILTVSSKLFVKNGWEATTTRDIAFASEVATGTVFNYFPSKEAVVAALLEEAFAKAQEEFASSRDGKETLEEDLFGFIMTGLNRLRKLRHVLAGTSDALFSPLARSGRDCAGEVIRIQHLEQVVRLLAEHGVRGPLSSVAMQIYWTLYLGVFAFWAADESPHQEDTLALLDQSLKLFIASLRGTKREEVRSRGSK